MKPSRLATAKETRPAQAQSRLCKVGTVTWHFVACQKTRFDVSFFCDTCYFPTTGSSTLEAAPFERYTLCVAFT